MWFIPDSDYIMTFTVNSKLKTYNFRTGNLIKEIQIVNNRIGEVDMSKDGRYLALITHPKII